MRWSDGAQPALGRHPRPSVLEFRGVRGGKARDAEEPRPASGDLNRSCFWGVTAKSTRIEARDRSPGRGSTFFKASRFQQNTGMCELSGGQCLRHGKTGMYRRLGASQTPKHFLPRGHWRSRHSPHHWCKILLTSPAPLFKPRFPAHFGHQAALLFSGLQTLNHPRG